MTRAELVLTRVVLSVARKRLARLVLLRLVLLLLRRFGVDGLLVPLGRGLQLGRVVLRSLVPYALDELAARVNAAGVYATESHLEGVPIHLESLHVALGAPDPQPRDQLLALGHAARDPSIRQLLVCFANDGSYVRGWRGIGIGPRRAHLGRELLARPPAGGVLAGGLLGARHARVGK